MDIWLRYVRKVMGTHSFILGSTLEATAQFAGGFSQGCYGYRLDNHNHPNCTYLTCWKRLGKALYDSNNSITPNNSSSTINTRIKANTDNQ